MSNTLNRRELMQALGAAGVAGLGGCYSQQDGGNSVFLPAGGVSVSLGEVVLEIVDGGQADPDEYPAVVMDTSTHEWTLYEESGMTGTQKYNLGGDSRAELIVADTLATARDAIDVYPAVCVSRSQNKTELVEE